MIRIVGKQPGPEEAARRASEAIQPSVARDMTSDQFEEATRDMAVATAAGELGVDVRWDLMNPRVRELVDDYETNRIVGITQTQRKGISSVVRQGFESGLRGPEIAGEIEQHYDEELIPNRATVIARTEMGIASNRATHGVHKTSGIVERQEWVATLDGRVRDSHRVMKGQIVGVDENFESGLGNEAPHPMAFGVAKDDIQCRCAAVAKVPERQPTSRWDLYRRSLWKQREAERLRAERTFEVLWQEVFRRQWREHVLPALAEVFDDVSVDDYL